MPTAVDMLRALRAADLEDRASERSDRAWRAECPLCVARSHGTLSLAITEERRDGPVRLVCRSGCENEEILAFLGLRADATAEDDPAAAPQRLRVLDMDRLLSTEPEPVPWIAEPLLVRGGLTMLVGREGLGKSMLALGLAAAMGHGSTMAGIACTQGRVLVVDAENGEREVHRRVHGLGVKPDMLVYAEADGFNLRSDLAQVEALVIEHRPDVLVLDSFRSLAPGLDENDSAPVEAILGPLRSLARRHGCAVLLLHHAGKSSESYRGSTAIGAAVELGLTLAREREDPQRTRRKLTNWKCRVAAEPDLRWISVEAHDGGIRIEIAQPFEGAERRPTRVEELTRRLGEVVADRGPLAWGELCLAAETKPGSGTSHRARDRAIEEGVLIRLEHGKYGPPGPEEDGGGQSSSQPSPIGGEDGWTDADETRAAA